MHILRPPQHKVFHWVSLHIPKTLVPTWICLQNWLKGKFLLVSGLVVFCCREPAHLNPTQLRSHNITWDCVHSSSPGWHMLAFPHTLRFPPRLQKSQCVIMPGLDSLAAVTSPQLLSTSGFFPRALTQIRHCCLTKLQPLPVLLKVSRKANPLFVNKPIVFLFQAKHLDGAFLADLLQFSPWPFHTPPSAELLFSTARHF